jgi:hypothetical protein
MEFLNNADVAASGPKKRRFGAAASVNRHAGSIKNRIKCRKKELGAVESAK